MFGHRLLSAATIFFFFLHDPAYTVRAASKGNENDYAFLRSAGEPVRVA